MVSTHELMGIEDPGHRTFQLRGAWAKVRVGGNGAGIWGTGGEDIIGRDKSGSNSSQLGNIDLLIQQATRGCPLCAQDYAQLPASATKRAQCSRLTSLPAGSGLGLWECLGKGAVRSRGGPPWRPELSGSDQVEEGLLQQTVTLPPPRSWLWGHPRPGQPGSGLRQLHGAAATDAEATDVQS